jgi:hypothetical protein
MITVKPAIYRRAPPHLRREDIMFRVPESGDVTRLLRDLGQGDSLAMDRLLPLVYDDSL